MAVCAPIQRVGTPHRLLAHTLVILGENKATFLPCLDGRPRGPALQAVAIVVVVAAPFLDRARAKVQDSSPCGDHSRPRAIVFVFVTPAEQRSDEGSHCYLVRSYELQCFPMS